MLVTGAFVGWTAAVAHGVAQTPPPQPPTGQPAAGQPAAPPRPARPEAYPSREPSDARGGENNGPNLLRSEVVLMDQKGEEIAQVVQNGRPDRGMPKFDMTTAQ